MNCWPHTVVRIEKIENEAGGEGVTLVNDCPEIRQCRVQKHGSTPLGFSENMIVVMLLIKSDDKIKDDQ